MAKKAGLVLGIAGVAALFALSTVVLNSLRDRADPPPQVILPAAQGAVEAASDRERAPDFFLTDWNGNGLNLADIMADGKPVILNFGASWCPACRMEKPGFENVYRDRGTEVNFVMVALVDGSPAEIDRERRYIEENGFTMPVYFDVLQEGARVYGVRGIPTTVFIDSDGYIVTRTVGLTREETLHELIDFMLP